LLLRLLISQSWIVYKGLLKSYVGALFKLSQTGGKLQFSP